MPLEWYGDAIREEIVVAARHSIDETTDEAAHIAATEHGWVSRSGNLEKQTISERAVVKGPFITGRFGATYDDGMKGIRSGFYGLFLEYRRPWLRPAADRTFPLLAQRIRRRLKR